MKIVRVNFLVWFYQQLKKLGTIHESFYGVYFRCETGDFKVVGHLPTLVYRITDSRKALMPLFSLGVTGLLSSSKSGKIMD